MAFISEIVMLMQLAWPLYLGIMTRLQWRHRPFMLFGALTFFVSAVGRSAIGAVLALCRRLVPAEAASQSMEHGAGAHRRRCNRAGALRDGINAYEFGFQLGPGLPLQRVVSSVYAGANRDLGGGRLAALLLVWPVRWQPSWLNGL